MGFVIEAEHYHRMPETGTTLTETTRTPHVHTHQVVDHLIEVMGERGDRFSGMETGSWRPAVPG
ncbi:hypothetical protein [Actinomadura hibisca]|uniref:hypothetical protein n=1 Tax=Actinomadura hibisca TaxID=68565 RepID=UPI00083408D4|nr:hypothetical protein [Actinomadura hibisca]